MIPVTRLLRSFNIKPNITATPAAGLSGDTITVDGSGFTASSSLLLSLVSSNASYNLSSFSPASIVTDSVVGCGSRQFQRIVQKSGLSLPMPGPSLPRIRAVSQPRLPLLLNKLFSPHLQAGLPVHQSVSAATGFSAGKPITINFNGLMVNNQSGISKK